MSTAAISGPLPSPLAVADLALAVLALEKAVAIYLEPAGDGHALSFEAPNGRRTRVPLPDDLGDAVVVRLALLSGLDIAAGSTHFGRLRVRHGARTAEILVMMNTSGQGLSLELRRIVTAATNSPATGERDRVGPYRLYEELGRGGTGVVYRAEHLALEKPVALKVMNPKIVAEGQRAAMLLREGRAASRARHPGIVDVTDFGSTLDGRIYLVMELVPWPTLEKLLDPGALAPQRAVTITRHILKALGAAHGVGVIHRDLKPSNVFVSPEDDVKLGDFGAATVELGQRPIDGDGQRLPVWGTPQYMAPEHSRGEADRRTDLYSLGVILFRMLAGHLPYDGGSFIQIMVKHIEDPVPLVTSPHSPLPPSLIEVVQRALAKQPDDRYQRASDMQRDLEHAGLQLLRKGWQRWLPT